MPNEIEFSVIVETHLKSFLYPTPIEFHYSDMHRGKYLSDESYIFGGYLEYDFASQVTIAYHRGIPLYGEGIFI
jgi:hypothetical protein